MTPLERKSLLGLSTLYAFRMLGLFMVLPVLALYAGDYSGSTTLLIGLTLGIYGLTQGLFQIPLGFLSDRLGRKPIIVFGMLLFLLGSIIAALSESLWGLIIGRGLQGAGAVASTIMALLSDLTTEQSRTKAMAAIGATIGAAFAISMVCGPVLADLWGLAGIFWITAALAILGILVVLLIPTPAVRGHNAEAQAVPQMFGKLLRDKELLRLNLGIGVLHFIQMASWVAVPVILEHNLAIDRDQHWLLYLLTMGLSFVAMLPFIIVAEKKRLIKPVFVGAIALMIFAEVVLGININHETGFVLGMFLFFMGFNLLEASLPSLISKIAPAGGKGTAMGIYSTSQFLGAFLGGVTGGAIAYNFGYQWIFWLSAGLITLWLLAAATMEKPRHLTSLVIRLLQDEKLQPASYVGKVPGVEDLVIIPGQGVAYFKVDNERFDREAFEAALGRECS
ncbi:MAG: MFS transporter [Pseudomonadales bacterium]|nr:MFS transporter [Pseudomonadales bacterium]